MPDGPPILDRILRAADGAGLEDVLLVANDPAPYRRFGRRIVPDLRPGLGPLGGIEAALASLGEPFEGVLVLPCDLPGLTADAVSALLSAFEASEAGLVYASTGDRGGHYLCAAVHRRHAAAVGAALDRGERGVGRLWRALGAGAVAFEDPHPFFNVNSPEERSRWIGLQEAAAGR
jgi:molybdopterin-guanine dinucleotide biosynthesis protein A